LLVFIVFAKINNIIGRGMRDAQKTVFSLTISVFCIIHPAAHGMSGMKISGYVKRPRVLYNNGKRLSG
jgi:hypothetical protein